MSEYFLSIDAGTSGGKAAIIDINGKILGFSKKYWVQNYIITEGLEPYGQEFDADFFWNIILQTILEAIKNAKIDSKQISAITSTSQRHGCVFLDKEGKELYAGPNRDARGLEIDTEEYLDNEELYNITGHGLPFLFALTRLMWFRENEEEIFDRIKHLVTIDGWVNYRLTGTYSIDDTAAAETLLFDINKRQWSQKVLDSFEIPYEILPEFIQFGKPISSILQKIAGTIGLKENTPVIMSCADTQASLIGSGAYEVGTVGVVAGSTMPIQMIINEPIIDPNQHIWTGAFIDKKYVLESNVGSSGDVHKWFIDSILKKLEVNNPYGRFEQLALSQPPGARGVIADLGPQIFNVQKMHEVPNKGGFSFLPMAYSFDEPVDIGSYSRALVENLSYAVRANLDQIKDISNLDIKKVFLVGGLSRSKVFCQVLANVINKEINVFKAEGAVIAGAIAGMIGIKHFKDYTEGIKSLITDHTVYYSQEDQSNEYDILFPEWKENYNRSREED
jgi:autoinducer 2 (AI-2) kinase